MPVTHLLSVLRVLVGIATIFFAQAANATFHLWRISEIYSNASGTVQYVKLTTSAGGQQFISGHGITASQGSSTHVFNFPADLPGDTANSNFLIGSAGFAALGVVAPDYVVPNGFLFLPNGSVDFAGVSVVNYSALPTDGVHALNASGASVVNAPANFAGATGSISAAAGTANYSDSWWNANESGWGITITDHGANAFVQWYTYDQTGHNQKYVISGGTFSADKCVFNGTVQHVTGPAWNAASFDQNLVVRNNAGSGSIDFCPAGLPAGTAVFSYSVDGVTASKQLTRLPFGNDVPHYVGTANTGAADYTDLWWNPAESGWGVSVTQHGNNIFFRIFVYDTDTRPLLFVVPGGTFTNATSFTGALQLTTGPYFGGNPFDPNQVARTTAGSATLTFSDANNGVLSYTVNGVTKTKAITRLAF